MPLGSFWLSRIIIKNAVPGGRRANCRRTGGSVEAATEQFEWALFLEAPTSGNDVHCQFLYTILAPCRVMLAFGHRLHAAQ
jgi:hypothetical protein